MISTKGSTNIGLAMEMALKQLLSRFKKVNQVSSVMLLSDGQDNQGNSVKSIQRMMGIYEQRLNKRNMDDYQIFSFGYGSGHNEEMLSGIATFKNGMYYYMKDNDSVDDCFLTCFSNLSSVLATKAKITLIMGENAQIKKVYGNKWDRIKNTKTRTINIGTITPEMAKNFICKIEIEKIPDNQKKLKIAFASLNYTTF